MKLFVLTKQVLQSLYLHYKISKAYITDGEQKEDLHIGKRLMIHHSHLMLIYFIFVHLVSPYTSLLRLSLNILASFGQFFVLRSKSYTKINAYVVGTALFSLISCNMRKEDSLRIIGITLTHHTQTLLLPSSNILKIFMLTMSILLVNNAQGNLSEMIQDGDLGMIEHTIKSLQYTWPLLFLVNQISAFYLTKECYGAFNESCDAQKQLKLTNQELKDANVKLKATLKLLEKTNKELSEAVKSRELFIASVSHEFRNPLNSLLGNIELLMLDVKNSKWLEMLETSKICGGVLLELVNNILDVAKINAEKVELNYLPTNVYSLIEKVWSISTIKMREKFLRGYLSISSNLPKHLETDAHRLNQILLNLIGNATKFTSKGFLKIIVTWHQSEDMDELSKLNEAYVNLTKNRTGSEFDEVFPPLPLSCTTTNTQSSDVNQSSTLINQGMTTILRRKFRIQTLSERRSSNSSFFTENDTKIQDKINQSIVSSSAKVGLLKIEVIDSGCGISRSALDRLFQPFSQADASITRQFGGTGLGLYISKQLIQKMGGQVHVHSKYGTGSSFCLLIPMRTVTQQEVVQKLMKEESEEICDIINPSQMLKVLVVDDDLFNQRIMTNYLNKLNFQVELASNGSEALNIFKSRHIGYYAFITMDIQMPVMGGLTACKHIRRFEAQVGTEKNIPVILITGNYIDINKSQDLDPNGETRASCFFRKPFTYAECKSLVETILPKNSTKCCQEL